jgi:hypothetical protein
MALRDRQRLAVFMTATTAETLVALPHVLAEFGVTQRRLVSYRPLAEHGARSARAAAEQLLGDHTAQRLDEVLPEFDLAADTLEHKLRIIRDLQQQWDRARARVRESLAEASRSAKRALRVGTEALLQGINAVLGSLINAFSAAGLSTGAVDGAKEAKEFGEALLSGARR